MSTVKATHFEHPSASTAGITLAANGSVVLPQGFTGGLGTNVVSTSKTDGFTTSSTSFVDVTGLSVVITPTSATSKVFVIAHVPLSGTGGQSTRFQVLRDATAIGNGAGGSGQAHANYSGDQNSANSNAYVYLDSPATTSATTYKVQATTNSGTAHIGRSAAGAILSCSITVIEVAA